jgi:hypothetical protein
MPYCPNCRTEFAAGSNCTDCGATLVAALPSGWRAGRDVTAARPAELAEFDDMVQLELIESQLRTVGIPSVRRPRAVALLVPEALLDRARQVMAGEEIAAAEGESDTLSLSELHRIRLVCSECDKEIAVDLLKERVPTTCDQCGHLFNLGPAMAVLDRYGDVMRMMANADFEIEVEPPHGG